jgi:UDP-N-acetylmuramyl pentapeptide phosphotransferase/UDP-N-acetylglucosamine-1-phosphate transferase
VILDRLFTDGLALILVAIAMFAAACFVFGVKVTLGVTFAVCIVAYVLFTWNFWEGDE